jgi:hypothetical protein
MSTTMTTDQRERIVLLEQRQQLRQLAVNHYSRAQAELHRFHEDLIRCEVLFAERMELEAGPSLQAILATMAGQWREGAEQARQPGDMNDAGVAITLDACAGQIEALLIATETSEPR